MNDSISVNTAKKNVLKNLKDQVNQIAKTITLLKRLDKTNPAIKDLEDQISAMNTTINSI